jgi:hypothetical protein
MSDIGPRRLQGEAPSGALRAIAANGDIVNPDEAIFPIVAQAPDGRFRLVGTGFFIAENGVFATAKHVLLDVFDRKGTQTAAIGLVQFLPGDQYLLRPILRCVSHEIADVAVGIAAAATHKETGAPAPNKLLTLTVKQPKLGDPIATYAYPKTVFAGDRSQQMHFYPAYYEGRVEEYFASGRDRVLMPAPCFQTSMHVHGGASGGPVVGPDGAVFGINSTGYDGTDCSFVSSVTDILSLRIPGVITPRDTSGRGVSVQELAEEGFVILRGRT